MRFFKFLVSGFVCSLSVPTAYAQAAAADHAQAKSSLDQWMRLYKRPKDIPHPKENPYSKERVLLGRTLFFDPRLSGSNWISCATCHNPALSFGDGLAKGLGHGMKALGRRTPTVLNLAWGEPMFWDGRMTGLEEQALGPIASTAEMNLTMEEMETRIAAIPAYKKMFDAAYPGEGTGRLTIAKAIAQYERTLVSGQAPFDRWIEGDKKAISASAIRGFVTFNGKAHCAHCHSGWRFTDDGFYDVGLKGEDLGRGTILPEIESMRFAFKTPTLRNVDHRGPYMHDGSERSLEDVVEFYDRGGDVRRPGISEHVLKLGLSPQEKGDLVAFLKTLTSVDAPQNVPVLPR